MAKYGENFIEFPEFIEVENNFERETMEKFTREMMEVYKSEMEKQMKNIQSKFSSDKFDINGELK